MSDFDILYAALASKRLCIEPVNEFRASAVAPGDLGEHLPIPDEAVCMVPIENVESTRCTSVVVDDKGDVVNHHVDIIKSLDGYISLDELDRDLMALGLRITDNH